MNPRFFLVRHGRAEKGSGADAERRLTPAGREEVRELARALGADLSLARVRTSPVVRARETAEILGAETGAPVEEDDALSPGRSSGKRILELGRRAPPGTALVGHNPELAEAIAVAAGQTEMAVPAGTIAAFDGEAKLLWMRAPR